MNGRYKIVFGGAMGAGKSQIISVLSEISVFTTEEINTDTDAHSKLLTTIGIDYGRIYVNNQTRIELYGTPGQHRFNFTWPIISKGALSVVILIDHQAKNPMQDLAYYVQSFSSLARHLIIAVTHVDDMSELALVDYRQWLSDHQLDYPLLAVDARKREDALRIINISLQSLRPTALQVVAATTSVQ